MANKRIKDLATTASSAASDDFMALDGVTNGTRKMSAANPSVTTLTTSGVITPGGSVHGANGSFTNPSFAFNSDQNTGLYRIGADNIGVAVGGVKALDISSTGVTATTTLADQGGTIAAQRNGLAPRQGLNFDGSSGAGVQEANGGRAFGTSDFTLSIWALFKSLPSGAKIINGQASGAGLYITNSSGRLYLIKNAVSLDNDSGVNLTTGIWYHIACTRTAGNVVFYINGIQTSSSANAVDYTGSTYALGYYPTSPGDADNMIGSVSGYYPFNRALSAAEVLALYQSGAVAASDYATGGVGVEAITNAADSTFVPNTGNWGAWNNGTLTQPGGSGTKLVYSAPYHNPAFGLYINANYLTVGKWYKLAITLADFTGGTTCVVEGSATSLVAGANTVVFQATTTKPKILLSGTTTGFSIAPGISIKTAGLLLAPDSAQVGGGLTWYDVSGNAANITLPATGVSWSLPTSGKAFSLSLASTTAGASNAGALVVAGGISAAGNSYFGSVGTFVGGVSTAGAVSFTAASGQAAGSLAKNATYGLTAYGVAGSANDVTLLNSAGTVVMANPTGTTTATFAGAVTVNSSITSGAGSLLLNGASGNGVNINNSLTGGVNIGAVPTQVGILSVRPVADGIFNFRNAASLGSYTGGAIDMLNDASNTVTNLTFRAAAYNFLTGAATFAGAVTTAGSVLVSPGASAASSRGVPYALQLTGTDAVAAGGLLFSSTNTNPVGLLSFAPNSGTLTWAARAAAGNLSSNDLFSITTAGAATFAGAVTANGQLIGKGTATNDSAAAGYIGEYASSTGSGVALTTGVAANIASLVLSAGDWDVTYVALFAGAITGTATTTSISATSATHNYTVGSYIVSPTVPTAFSDTSHTITERVSTTGATFYFVASMVFTAGTGTAGGKIHARRVR